MISTTKLSNIRQFKIILNNKTVETNINERIKAVSEHFFNGNTSAMARAVFVKQATLRDIISEKVKPSYDTIRQIVECPTLPINSDWLITGKGDMMVQFDVEESGLMQKSIEHLKNQLQKKPITISDKAQELAYNILQAEQEIKDTRPRIPYTAAAGTLTSAVEGVTPDQCEQIPRITAFPNYDFTIIIKGNSMEPKYEGGDEVACKRIDNTSFIQWGKVHVLDTAQGIIIKRVYEDDDKVRCVSYNPEYPDFSISKEEIYSMSLIVGLLRM